MEASAQRAVRLPTGVLPPDQREPELRGEHPVRHAVRIVWAPLARRGARRKDPLYDACTQGESRGRTIWIDPRLPNVAKTLFHELIHTWHPSWSEDRVRASEEYRWARMGWKEKAGLYRMLAKARLEGAEE